MVNYGQMEFQKILVPVGGNEADEEAMRLACRLIKKEKNSKIWAVYVIVIKRSLPLDAEIESDIKHAEALLDKVEKIARDEKIEVETDILQAREAGPAIIDEAIERGVNVITMGVRYKRHFGQFNLGNVVPYVLKNAPCPVILYHQ
jgi:nucleotide-binding universal stress UspA family protein